MSLELTQLVRAFISNRFQNGSSEKNLLEPIKRGKLKTMEASNKTVKVMDHLLTGKAHSVP